MLPFYTGQIPTADDFNQLAVKAELSGSGGASMIGYGATTVAAVLASITAPAVASVAGKTGAVTLTVADVSGAAATHGDPGVQFSVGNATGSAHAISLGQADLRYAPAGSSGTGTVTSVGLAMPADYSITGSPVTGAGTFTVTRASQPAKYFLASPNSAAGTPVYRPIVSSDLPTVGIGQGGTGQTTAQAALNALTSVSGAINEYVLTKDTASGNAMWKAVASTSGALNQALTGQFYENLGARVNRIADRLFVGDAVTNDGTATNSGGIDWMEQAHGNTTSVSQFAALSTEGKIGVLGAVRSSDNTLAMSESGIGLCGFALNDNTSLNLSVFASYLEAQRYAGAGATQGMEIDIVNLGSNVINDPYNMLPSGMNCPLWLNSGGGNHTTNPTAAALCMLGNGSRFNKGIVFGNAVFTDDGAGQPVVSMAQYQKLNWYYGINSEAARIRCDASAPSLGIIFENNQISLKTLGGSEVFRFDSGGGLTAPAGLSFTAPYFNFNSASLSGSAGGVAFYLPVKINGVDKKIAIYDL